MHLWPAPVRQIVARNEWIGAPTEVEIADAVAVPAAAEAVAAVAREGEAVVASVEATAAEGTRVISGARCALACALQNKAATKIAALPFARTGACPRSPAAVQTTASARILLLPLVFIAHFV